ncbi:MAG: hypothetical protein ACE5DN_00065 [Flavobacteriales bacterium]
MKESCINVAMGGLCGLLLCLCALRCPAQEPDTARLQRFEKRLVTQRLAVIQSKSDKERIAANESFILTLDSMLEVPGFYRYPFSEIKTIGIISSPDKSFRFITWNLPFDDGSNYYYCYLQRHNKKKDETETLRLHDMSADMQSVHAVTGKTLYADHWYGALYYRIIPFKRRGKKYYVLLGWDGYSEERTRKIMDVLFFSGSGRPKFGAPVFRMEKKTQKRIVFEFSAQAVMTIRYEEKNRRIVFDHLSPDDPAFKGNYAHYGPDLSYDALLLKKGKWRYTPDVDVRNPR